MSITSLIILFAIYSFLGWCAEVIYQYWTQKKFINRGFLYGPFCPIYGICILLVINLLERFSNNLIVLFLISTILISFIEYTTSFVLEKLFHLKWWDYTDDPLNLHGRICFHFSLGWGLATVFAIKIVHPILINLVESISLSSSKIIIIILISYFTIDLLLTFIKLISPTKTSEFLKSHFRN
ncbi:putative ABC transporter permease [Clostridium sp.]|uniref:putative ABC transporter permease n=1 Tax=Clostridium sp. TaxID=1506 RepID=UPI002FC66071